MLTERQQQILRIVIDNYIVSVEPVGSRFISKKERFPYSPATIRNDMADLEELGYLKQPHASAGRIPSELGYRFYVDHLVRPLKLSRSQLKEIRRLLAEMIMEGERVIQETANLLADMTNYTAFILGPEIFEIKLKHMQIIPLEDKSAVAIFVTNTGHVETKKMAIPEDVSIADIEKLVNLLNVKLQGVPFFQLKTRLYSEVSYELQRHVDRYEQWMKLLDGLLAMESKDERFFLSGTTNMLTQPEFQDVQKVKILFDWLENPSEVIHLLENSVEGIRVRIGRENQVEAMNDCSLVSASYTVDGHLIGTIGFLGPTRMEYNKVIGLLNAVSNDLPQLFVRWQQIGY